MRTVLIGAGNIAVSLSAALLQKGHTIAQIWSRTHASAQQLADRLDNGGQTAATDRLADVLPDADLYILAVRDSALSETAERLGQALTEKSAAYAPHRLFVHVACTQSIETLRPLRTFGMTGVLYPLQSFVKSRVVELNKVAFFTEGDSELSARAVRELALSFSPSVYAADYEQRQYIHFAGNMAGNFSNCLYAIAKEALDEAGIPFEVLFSIIDETAHKIHTLPPREAQSGPAARGDEVTTEKHLALIDRMKTPTAQDKNSPVTLKDVYRFFTHNIQSEATR